MKESVRDGCILTGRNGETKPVRVIGVGSHKIEFADYVKTPSFPPPHEEKITESPAITGRFRRWLLERLVF